MIFALCVWALALGSLVMVLAGWPLRGGFLMIATAFLPWVDTISSTEPLGPGAGVGILISGMQLLLGFAAIIYGVVLASLRRHRRSSEKVI